ncbi:MAG TPA: hypothetical protein VEI01_05515 [Terriglobales bacterium]|nr:hypothetical protein [Terriglobales bacterium]
MKKTKKTGTVGKTQKAKATKKSAPQQNSAGKPAPKVCDSSGWLEDRHGNSSSWSMVSEDT